MRYNGQGHEIEITLPDRHLTADDIAPLTTAFEEEYRKQFSRPVPGMQIEILNWAVRVATSWTAPCHHMPDNTCIDHHHRTSETRPITCDVDGALKQAAFVAPGPT